MKASRSDSETSWFEFSKGVLTSSTRLLLILQAWLLLTAQATAAQPPTVTIDGASQVTGISAIVGWSVNANGLSTSVVFRWGNTTAYDRGSNYFLLAPTDVPITFSNLLTGL